MQSSRSQPDLAQHALASEMAASVARANAPAGAGRFIHPEASAMFEKLPCTQYLPVFGKSCEGYGPRCVTALGLCYFFNKGLGNNVMSQSRLAMFTRRFGIDGTRYQRLQGISKMGWSVKDFTAAVSDVFALFGYTKRWLCFGSCLLGAVFAVLFGILPAKPSSADLGAGFLFLSNFCMANIDILSEGHYSRLMRQQPTNAPELLSWIWWFILAASLLSAVIQGPLSDAGIPQVGLFVSGGCQLVTALFFIFNWYGELRNRDERFTDARVLHQELYELEHAGRKTRSPRFESAFGEKNLHPELGSDQERQDALDGEHDEELVLRSELDAAYADDEEQMWAEFQEPDVRSYCCGAVEFNWEVCKSNWRLLLYSLVMVISAVAMTCVTILGTTMELLYCAIVVAVVNCSLAFWATPLIIAKAIVFIYFDLLLYLQINGAVDSFYTAPEECLPDGPHFTFVFYTTIGSVIGNIGGIFGVAAFSYIFAKHSYQIVFVITTTVQVLASIFDIIIVKRWNLAIGIPDHAMYLLGDAVVYEVCYYLGWMPMIMIISRICPRGSESMIYAVVASLANMGQSMSSTVGSILLEKVWPIVTQGVGTCDFHNLPMLIVVSHLLLPLLVIPLSFLLLPHARICDDIDVDGQALRKDAKKRLRGRSAASETAGEPYSEDALEESRK